MPRVTTQLVHLRYPKGRVHSCPLHTASRLSVGDEFELYGRQWRVTSLSLAPGSLDDYDVECEPVGRPATTLAGHTADDQLRA
jgi:hypothetical protein